MQGLKHFFIDAFTFKSVSHVDKHNVSHFESMTSPLQNLLFDRVDRFESVLTAGECYENFQ